MKIIIWHISFDLACLRGLASKDEHKEPYLDAVTGFGSKQPAAVTRLWRSHCYEPVAVYSSDNESVENELEEAWNLTNHVYESWNRKDADPRLEPFHHERNRSSMVGDVFEVIQDGITGPIRSFHVVAACGFVKLDF